MHRGSCAEKASSDTATKGTEQHPHHRPIHHSVSLRFNDIRRSAPCRILEEKLHLPALLVDLRYGQCGQHEVVGQKHQSLASDGIEVTHAAQRFRICRGRSDGGQNDGLVRAHARAFVHRMRIAALEQHVLLGAHHEEG